MEENKLIEGCLQHKREHQRILYDTFSRQMYGICLRYHSDTDLANEALQRAFIKVFEKLESFKKTGNLGAWIRTIVVRTCIDVIKEQKGLKYEDLDQIPNLSNTRDEEAEGSFKNINYKEMLALLNKLPMGYKTVFSLYVLDGYKHNEIAETLNISISTSRSQLHKSRQMMKELVCEELNNNVKMLRT